MSLSSQVWLEVSAQVFQQFSLKSRRSAKGECHSPQTRWILFLRGTYNCIFLKGPEESSRLAGHEHLVSTSPLRCAHTPENAERSHRHVVLESQMDHHLTWFLWTAFLIQGLHFDFQSLSHQTCTGLGPEQRPLVSEWQYSNLNLGKAEFRGTTFFFLIYLKVQTKEHIEIYSISISFSKNMHKQNTRRCKFHKCSITYGTAS